ncbi:MAG: hypothetical protein HZC11_01085 [Nitrospirae bacterium]|nr:hypothetical protein [Nitrospirota bacterium]
MSKGYLIVFTGIDGSGKTTQAELLAKNLRQDGLHVSYVWSRWEPFFLKPLLKRWRSGAAKDTAVSGSDFNKIKAKKQRLLNNPV